MKHLDDLLEEVDWIVGNIYRSVMLELGGNIISPSFNHFEAAIPIPTAIEPEIILNYHILLLSVYTSVIILEVIGWGQTYWHNA